MEEEDKSREDQRKSVPSRHTCAMPVLSLLIRLLSRELSLISKPEFSTSITLNVSSSSSSESIADIKENLTFFSGEVIIALNGYK